MPHWVSVRFGEFEFCCTTCRIRGQALKAAIADLPHELIHEEVERVYRSKCSLCSRGSELDLHESHKTWSLLTYTRSECKTELCCSDCGKGEQWAALIHCLLLVWWGIPGGLTCTPTHIYLNASALLSHSPSSGPSMRLRKAVQKKLATRLAMKNAG